MKHSRFRTLLIGVLAGVVYAFLTMLLLARIKESVSITLIFVLPIVLGAIPVLFSTKEQLKSYAIYLLCPWLSVFTLFSLCYFTGAEGEICLLIIVGPFIIFGSLTAFALKLGRLKDEGKKTPLYSMLLLPFLFLLLEHNIQPVASCYTVQTTVEINADRQTVWGHIKNVRNIQPTEIQTHFIHWMGIPKPLNGELDKEGVGGIRSITWEKGIKFREIINNWQEGTGFSYAIDVDPASIPPTTLDEHVMIGGKYFDVVAGSYHIDSINPTRQKVTLTCQYRVTTTLNFYCKWWADGILDDFNEMILEVIKGRCENK
jgi:hypothetical protein